MTWVIVESAWIEARGRMKDEWNTLSDDDLDGIAGRRDTLVTTLRDRQGCTLEAADQQVADWESRNKDLIDQTYEQVKPYLGIAKQ
ncbi:MAG TPA: general stress protein CsbD [Burkholderiales bacterium]|jgi:uncharacterized protein YjbJ (UPF0337 family)|nr:general stress protein CsbD [Burkholderiales bacterium]